MGKGKIIELEDRVPKLKQERRKKGNKRLIIYISGFFFITMLVLFFQSSFSEITKVMVTGNQYVTEEEVIQLSGITKETSYWKLSPDEVVQKIDQNNEVESVKVEKKFPGQINIVVKEYNTVGYVVKESSYYPVLESGKILEQLETKKIPVVAPLLFNFEQGEVLQELAAELKKLPESILESISEIHYAPKLPVDTMHVTLYMNEGFEVSVSIRDFSEKMMTYPSIVQQQNKNVKGIIDLEVGAYFSPYGAEVIK